MLAFFSEWWANKSKRHKGDRREQMMRREQAGLEVFVTSELCCAITHSARSDWHAVGKVTFGTPVRIAGVSVISENQCNFTWQTSCHYGTASSKAACIFNSIHLKFFMYYYTQNLLIRLEVYVFPYQFSRWQIHWRYDRRERGFEPGLYL